MNGRTWIYENVAELVEETLLPLAKIKAGRHLSIYLTDEGEMIIANEPEHYRGLFRGWGDGRYTLLHEILSIRDFGFLYSDAMSIVEIERLKELHGENIVDAYDFDEMDSDLPKEKVREMAVPVLIELFYDKIVETISSIYKHKKEHEGYIIPKGGKPIDVCWQGKVLASFNIKNKEEQELK